MNAPPHTSGRATVFKSNRSQAVRIPKELAFPDGVKQVVVRKQGRSLVITPVNQFWDEFFDQPGIDIVEPAELAFEDRETF
jgi:antitoxin VapB